MRSEALGTQPGETVFLSKRGFPDKFEILRNEGIDVEGTLIQRLNDEGKARSVSRIQYRDIGDFPALKQIQSMYFGVICQTTLVSQESTYPADSLSAIDISPSGNGYRHSIVAFLFISDSAVNTRNAFISQSIFPALFRLIEMNLESASRTLTQFPSYFVNLATSPNTLARSIMRDVEAIHTAGIKPTALFEPDWCMTVRPPTISQLMKHSEDEYFDLDKQRKIFRILPNGLRELLKWKGESPNFDGSKEKFFLIKLVPFAIRATREGYIIDYSELTLFLNKHEGVLSTSRKFEGLRIIEQLMKKLSTHAIR